MNVPTTGTPASGQRADEQSQGGLCAHAPDRLRIGAAVAGYGRTATTMPLLTDARYRQVLATEFSSLTPENQTKWEWLQPAPGEFDFAAADAIVDFAAAHGQHVRGHTLLWHNQNPDWITGGDHSPQELRRLLRTHIQTVVGRYAGRIQHWDVVNEIVDDDGRLRTEQNPWLGALGPDIIAEAFIWAHEADPDALLFGNDFDVEGLGAKSDAWYDLILDLRSQGVPVHGFGVQGHLDMSAPFPEDLPQNLQRFADLGLRTAFTELDVRGPVTGEGGLSEEHLARQADWYARITRIALEVPGCESLTPWGVLDEQSWVPGWFPGTGGALLLHGDYQPKPAYHAVREALAAGGQRPTA